MLNFQSLSLYITINGNEESYGSSFSDSESNVVASVDFKHEYEGWEWFGGGNKGWLEAVEGGAQGQSEEKGT